MSIPWSLLAVAGGMNSGAVGSARTVTLTGVTFHTRTRLSTWMPSLVLVEAVQPVTALPEDAVIPTPVLPLALQLLTVLEAPTEMPPPRFSSPVER